MLCAIQDHVLFDRALPPELLSSVGGPIHYVFPFLRDALDVWYTNRASLLTAVKDAGTHRQGQGASSDVYIH